MFFNSTKRTLKQIDEEKIKLGYPTLLYPESFLSNNKSTRFFSHFFNQFDAMLTYEKP